MKEVKVWSKLQHPNVVPLHGVVNDFGHLPGLVLPVYKNSNLNKYLKNRPNADRVKLVCAIQTSVRFGISRFDLQLLDVAHGLHYLHTLETPVHHGELKGVCLFIFIRDHHHSLNI